MNAAAPADRLLSWLKGQSEQIIGKRFAQQHGPLRSGAELDAALDELAAGGLARLTHDGKTAVIELATLDATASRFSDLRHRRGALETELDRLHGERQRCLMMAGNSDANDRLATARSALEGLYARRAAGEAVPDDVVEQAVEALGKATAAASVGAVACAGARTAAARFENQAAAVRQQLSQVDAEARAHFRQQLVERENAEQADFQNAIAEFSERYVRHHAMIAALAGLSTQHNLGLNVTPVARAEWFCTTVSRPPFDYERNVAKPIASEAGRINAELSALLP